MKLAHICHGLVLASTFTLAYGVGAQDPPGGGEEGSLASTNVGTAFSYQGQLILGGNLYNGLAEFRFAPWDAPTGGIFVGENILQTLLLNVANG